MKHKRADIKNLLKVSFNHDELRTLAFVVLPDIHNDLAGATHERATEMITDFSFRRGLVPDVLAYIKKSNPHQYSRYMERIGDIALANEEFESAITAYRETEANQKLENAIAQKHRATIERLKAIAVNYETVENWIEAEKVYRELVAIDNENPRWIEGVDRSEKEQLLSDLYEEAVSLKDNGNYQGAEERLQRIINIRATYRDAAQMLANIVAERAQPVQTLPVKQSPINNNIKYLGGVIAILLISVLMFAGISLANDEDPAPTAPSIVEITETAVVPPTIPTATETPISPTATIEPTNTVEIATETAVAPSSDEPPNDETKTSVPEAEPTQIAPLLSIDEAIARFQERGKIIVGVRDDAPPFGQLIDGQFVGFDIDLIKAFAARWFGDPNAVEFIAVPAGERIAIAQNHEVDFFVAAFTATPSRCSEVLCSQIYFQDGTQLLVQRTSDILGREDLAGKPIAVVEGTTADEIFAELILTNFFTEEPFIITYKTRAEAIDALREGRVVAYSTDGKILQQFEDNDLEVVGDVFSDEPYTIGIPPEDIGTQKLINATLQEMKQDQWYRALYESHFDCETPYRIAVDEEENNNPSFVKYSEPAPDTKCVFEIDLSRADSHVVQRGETLGGIAKDYYGDYNFYLCIQNASGIEDVRSLSIGSSLTLPSVQDCLDYFAQNSE